LSDLRSSNGIPSSAPVARRATWRQLVALMRPRQWTKNLLLFAALIFAERLLDLDAVLLATIAFASFCLASSSVYVVNDLLDVERDRAHPQKRNRPIASGQVSRSTAAVFGGILAGAALGLAWGVGTTFTLWCLVYMASSHLYSIAGKNVVILDVMMIAAGFVIRAVAGAVAIDVPYSDWFILCTLFVAVFIAASKRQAEWKTLESGAGKHRPVLDVYTAGSLSALTMVSMGCALMSYALYVIDEIRSPDGTASELLALTVPFVMFGLFRYTVLVETGTLGDKPEEVLLQDRPMQVCLAGFAAIAMAALYLGG
jgi:4-hydroxybenzoate polyprenyltransferase